MNTTIQAYESHRGFVDAILKSIKIQLFHAEIGIVITALSEYIQNDFQTKFSDYEANLFSSAAMYSAFTLSKRLFTICLSQKECYNITLDRNEIFAVQSALFSYVSKNDNMTANLLYGRIHQKTV